MNSHNVMKRGNMTTFKLLMSSQCYSVLLLSKRRLTGFQPYFHHPSHHLWPAVSLCELVSCKSLSMVSHDFFSAVTPTWWLQPHHHWWWSHQSYQLWFFFLSLVSSVETVNSSLTTCFKQLVDVSFRDGHADCLLEPDPVCQSDNWYLYSRLSLRCCCSWLLGTNGGWDCAGWR